MKTRLPPLPQPDLKALRRLVTDLGLDETASRLGINEMTIARAAAGNGVNSTTRIAVHAALSSLASS